MEVACSQPSSQLDPDLAVGLALVRKARRTRLIETLKVGTVWIALLILLTLGLLQLRFDPQYVFKHAGFVLQGAWTTIWVSVVSILIASVLALFGALGRLSRNPIAQGISSFYISVIRGTPLLIQIYLIYHGLPQLGQQLKALGYPELARLLTLDAFQAGVLALSLNYGAYMTEIFRAGLQAVGHGQYEAAAALGMTRWQTLRHVILPQAVRIIIPDVGNQFIAMQKDSALVSVMGVWEITFRANRLARKDAKFVEMLLVAAALYWILTVVSSWLQSRLEKRMAHAYER
ncbi:MAG: amino acid ABC transporter permease [Anaerolineae bacterium]|nr:amino acid ABC transporter permease [Anaerolineae bacterium]MDW7991792.1 amino acid ABC transporter permease [Anaerolineae bacterium]